MTAAEEAARDIHILVVDDEEIIREMLQETIEYAGYDCVIAADGAQALGMLDEKPVDVIITDIKMPGISGIELLREAKKRHDVDVIVMTGFIEDFTYEMIIELGASDFIGKPFRNKELIVRLKRVLRERNLLRERRRAHRELRESYLDTIKRLAVAAEYRDEETGDHIHRISRYCALISEELGLPAQMIQNIRYASPMHDIGKIGIPDRILLKEGKLTPEEFEIMKTHTTIGASILANSNAEILQFAERIAISHHERWDGGGYPMGVAGDKIPITGRIVGLADVFDALTSERPYKEPYPLDVALEMIRRGAGGHFDPEVAKAFLARRDGIKEILREMNPASVIGMRRFQWSERERGPLPEMLSRIG